MSKEVQKSQGIALFEGKEVRKVSQDGDWWFVIADVISILTDSVDPAGYIKDMRRRDDELSKGWGQIATPLSIPTAGGPQKLNCANTEGILRIIQSVPSQRAEPFKRWLAQVGYERIQEIEDPELAMTRMIETYEKKGYPKEWIDIRTRGIPVRKGLTNEWDQRGGGPKAYGILTNEVYKAYSGMNNEEWKKFKGMKSGNLRDGMTPTELILTMLAEQATTDITKARDADGIGALKKASKDGGGVAFKARQELIEQTGKDPITNQNFLAEVRTKQVKSIARPKTDEEI